MRQRRQRTESMVQRFARTSVSEGFDLWDKDYLLGALRLFLFKGETAPPFQVGPCMDATGEILVQMEEYEDASEQFTLAAEKYALIQRNDLAQLMRIKAAECTDGPEEALRQVTAYVSEQREMTPGLARAHAYHAQLLLKTAKDINAVAPEAVAAARLACNNCWDRVHVGYVTLGDALCAAGRPTEACEEYQRAVEANENCIAGLERHMSVLRDRLRETTDGAAQSRLRSELLRLLDAAIALHPRPTLLREKAFLLSETAGDAAALDFLEPLIRNPPPEEADAAANQTVTTLLKAKAAILADSGSMKEALKAAEAALRESPGDEEAAAIVAEIQQSV
ncbi:uncharacterized protein TM35_000351860 [Trypanosoma theileri]|uniref:Uncharacterized protein n=1 Tax=Trypanosoma theileri TaxID=67003 RepID=A0A1X0NKZ6_9TRYP|nr:uncharacterized protein TM35_000351860 [Trypanosoma theileri]ORC85442.1 hypothetical protein TM35_000351860 [Trypanosoma theileri]